MQEAAAVLGEIPGSAPEADQRAMAARWLAELLPGRGDLDGAEPALRAHANVDDWFAAKKLAILLGERNDLDGLQARAEAGDWFAAERLADLLGERNDLDGLQARVDGGDWYAAAHLLGLLIKQGRGEEASRLRRFGLNPDGSIART